MMGGLYKSVPQRSVLWKAIATFPHHPRFTPGVILPTIKAGIVSSKPAAEHPNNNLATSGSQIVETPPAADATGKGSARGTTRAHSSVRGSGASDISGRNSQNVRISTWRSGTDAALYSNRADSVQGEAGQRKTGLIGRLMGNK